MPCDAIAVASGQVPLDLARELESLGTEAVAQALLALLRRQFAHLGEPEPVDLWGAHSGARASGIGICLDNYSPTALAEVLVRVSQEWRGVAHVGLTLVARRLGLEEIQMLVHEEEGQGQATLVVYWPGGETTISHPADGRAGQMRALREVIGQIRAQVTT